MPRGVVPVCLRSAEDLDRAVRSLVSLWAATDAGDAVVAVFGESAPALVSQLAVAVHELDFELDRSAAGGPRAAAVNAGLRRALREERDAVLLEPGVELRAPALAALLARVDGAGRPAAVCGGRLLDAAGNVHRAGFYFSRLTRTWGPRLEYAPADLPQALRPCRCPVGDGLMLVRYAALQATRLYDEALPSPLDAVDFCLQVFAAGLECIYEPAAAAVRDGSRVPELGRAEAFGFDAKWHGTDFSPFVPPVL
jgi:GT2 family glycosyltransferase